MRKNTNRIDAAALKKQAADRWREVLSALGGLPLEILDGKNHPCPKCGGTDRFRMIDVEAGALFCNQCFNKDCGDGIDALMWLRGWTFNAAKTELSKHLGIAPTTANGKPRIAATYDYRNEKGELLYQVVRYEPKDFKQRQPKPGGGWTWSVKGVRLVPYRLPELLAADPSRPIVIVEGEKDADRLASLGIIATTNVGGAGKWRQEYNEYLRGRIVFVTPDNDDKGRTHTEIVAWQVDDVARNVRVVNLPGLPEKGDVSDWLDQGHTREELWQLAINTPIWNKPSGGELPLAAQPATEPAEPEPRPYVPFPTDALPQVVASFVHESAAALGCDESFVALPLLATLASAVGNSRRIRLKHSWCEPCVVWAVVVGESGTLKSPAHDVALEPLQRLQTAAFAQWREAMDRHASDKATYDADLADWKKKGRKNREPPPDEPDEPVCVRYLCADTTVEALAVLLEQQPRGLLMARDELSGWVNSFDAYKASRGADVAHWLSMHRAGQVIWDRKTGRRIIHVPRAAVSITGTVQPKALAAALCGRYQAMDVADAMDRPSKEHFDNGLAARLLFTMPPPRAKRWNDDDLPPEAKRPIRDLLDRLLALDMGRDDDGEQVPIDLPLSATGKAAWVRFYNEHAQEQVDLAGDLAAAWSKLEGYAARFALLVHVIRSVSGEPGLSAVDEHSIAAGVTLARWFADEAARVYAVIGGDVEKPEAWEEREVIRIVAAHEARMTASDVRKRSRNFATAEEVEVVMSRIVASGKAQWEIPDRESGGRPTRYFVLVSNVSVSETTKIPGETEVSDTETKGTEPETRVSGTEGGVCEWTG